MTFFLPLAKALLIDCVLVLYWAVRGPNAEDGARYTDNDAACRAWEQKQRAGGSEPDVSPSSSAGAADPVSKAEDNLSSRPRAHRSEPEEPCVQQKKQE